VIALMEDLADFAHSGSTCTGVLLLKLCVFTRGW
jgi:hypothetical protein